MTSTRSSRKQRTHSQFSRVFFWELGRGRILTFFYVLGTLLIMPGSVLMSILSNEPNFTDMTQWAGETVETVRGYFANSVSSDYGLALGSGMATLVILYALIYVGQSFQYMHARRSVDLFHAIPVRRKPLLLGKYFALLLCMELPIVLGSALSALLCHFKNVPVDSHFFLVSCGDIALMAAACLTFAMFFLVISGTLTGACLSLIAVSLGWPIFMAIVDNTMWMFLPGYVSVIPSLLYTLFCPAGATYQCFGGSFMGLLGIIPRDGRYDELIASGEGGISWFHIWWLLFTVALLVLSIFYYDRRKSEAAENYFSFPVIRGLLRGLVSIAVGLQTGIVVGNVLDSNLAYLVSIAVGAALAHIVVQFILTHSFQSFWRTIPAFLCAMVLTGGFLMCLYTGGLGYVQRMPDPAEVERVDFTLPPLGADGSKESYLSQMTGLDLYNKKEQYMGDFYPVFLKEEEFSVLEDLQRCLLETRYPGPYLPFGSVIKRYGVYDLNVTYTLKDGTALKRNYGFPIFREDTKLLEALAKVQKLDAIQSFCLYNSAGPAYISSIEEDIFGESYDYSACQDVLTPDEQQQVWDTFAEELNSPSFRTTVDLPTYEDWLMEMEQRQGDSSIEWDEFSSVITKEVEKEETTTYYISLKNIPYKELPAELQQLITILYESQEDEPSEPASDIDSVSGYNVIVPECCVKTRQLIHELTEPRGEWNYYSSDIEDE